MPGFLGFIVVCVVFALAFRARALLNAVNLIPAVVCYHIYAHHILLKNPDEQPPGFDNRGQAPRTQGPINRLHTRRLKPWGNALSRLATA